MLSQSNLPPRYVTDQPITITEQKVTQISKEQAEEKLRLEMESQRLEEEKRRLIEEARLAAEAKAHAEATRWKMKLNEVVVVSEAEKELQEWKDTEEYDQPWKPLNEVKEQLKMSEPTRQLAHIQIKTQYVNEPTDLAPEELERQRAYMIIEKAKELTMQKVAKLGISYEQYNAQMKSQLEKQDEVELQTLEVEQEVIEQQEVDPLNESETFECEDIEVVEEGEQYDIFNQMTDDFFDSTNDYGNLFDKFDQSKFNTFGGTFGKEGEEINQVMVTGEGTGQAVQSGTKRLQDGSKLTQTYCVSRTIGDDGKPLVKRYLANRITKKSADGKLLGEVQEMYHDNQSNKKVVVIERTLNGKGRRLVKKRDLNGGATETEQFYNGIQEEDSAAFNKAWKETAQEMNYVTQFGKPLKIMEFGKARTVIAGADSIYGAPSLLSRNPNLTLKLVPQGASPEKPKELVMKKAAEPIEITQKSVSQAQPSQLIQQSQAGISAHPSQLIQQSQAGISAQPSQLIQQSVQQSQRTATCLAPTIGQPSLQPTQQTVLTASVSQVQAPSQPRVIQDGAIRIQGEVLQREYQPVGEPIAQQNNTNPTYETQQNVEPHTELVEADPRLSQKELDELEVLSHFSEAQVEEIERRVEQEIEEKIKAAQEDAEKDDSINEVASLADPLTRSQYSQIQHNTTNQQQGLTRSYYSTAKKSVTDSQLLTQSQHVVVNPIEGEDLLQAQAQAEFEEMSMAMSMKKSPHMEPQIVQAEPIQQASPYQQSHARTLSDQENDQTVAKSTTDRFTADGRRILRTIVTKQAPFNPYPDLSQKQSVEKSPQQNVTVAQPSTYGGYSVAPSNPFPLVSGQPGNGPFLKQVAHSTVPANQRTYQNLVRHNQQ
jgi:hypothetical protein